MLFKIFFIILLSYSLNFGQNLGNSVLLERKTSREFSTKKLTPLEITELLKGALSAPTGFNQRPLEIIVITNTTIAKEIVSKSGGAKSGLTALNSAPVTFVIVANKRLATTSDSSLILDAGIASQALITRATELGFASVPMILSPIKTRVNAIRNILNIPTYAEPQIMVSIGQPVSDTASGASVDGYNKTRIHFDKW